LRRGDKTPRDRGICGRGGIVGKGSELGDGGVGEGVCLMQIVLNLTADILSMSWFNTRHFNSNLNIFTLCSPSTF
jgi:hypothetical protein